MNQPFHLSLYYSTVVVLSLVAVAGVVCCGGSSSIFPNACHRFVVLVMMTSYLSHCHVKPATERRHTVAVDDANQGLLSLESSTGSLLL